MAWEDGETPGAQDPDKNSGNIALVQSVLCAGLYPHVAAFMRPDPQREVSVRMCWPDSCRPSVSECASELVACFLGLSVEHWADALVKGLVLL